MTAELPESRVVQIWRDCPERMDLETTDGGKVNVLYPGRPNDGSGADFREAVIQTEQGQLTGDIEIHTLSSDWRAHRHHRDPRYNRVVLQVVFRHDTSEPVALENGHSVPTISLENWLKKKRGTYSSPAPVPCQGPGERGDIRRSGDILEVAGEQRFQARAAGYQTFRSPAEAGQALYCGIMGAMGYSRNKYPMLTLACRMPLHHLETMTARATPDTACLGTYQAMLLGTAGLLPSQRTRRWPQACDDAWAERLEQLWAATGEGAAMSESDWQFFRVRPGNYPERRIAAMSLLLLRYREKGLLAGLLRQLNEIPAEAGPNELEKALMINAGDGYPATGENNLARLGKARAAEIIINVLLPFAVAWGRVTSHPELAQKATALYHRYPARLENTLIRHMRRQLGIDSHKINTARRQQGLLHIFKMFCALGGCPRCPLNQPV